MEFSRPEYWKGWPFPSPGDLPNPGIELRSPAQQADSLPAESWGKPKNTGVGGLSLLQQVFLTQRSNQGVFHCRQILYQLNYQGSPNINKSITREGSNFHQYSFPSFLILNFNFFTVRSFCVQLFYPPEVEVLSPWPDVFLGKAVENGSTMVLFFWNVPVLLSGALVPSGSRTEKNKRQVSRSSCYVVLLWLWTSALQKILNFGFDYCSHLGFNSLVFSSFPWSFHICS